MEAFSNFLQYKYNDPRTAYIFKKNNTNYKYIRM